MDSISREVTTNRPRRRVCGEGLRLFLGLLRLAGLAGAGRFRPPWLRLLGLARLGLEGGHGGVVLQGQARLAPRGGVGVDDALLGSLVPVAERGTPRPT